MSLDLSSMRHRNGGLSTRIVNQQGHNWHYLPKDQTFEDNVSFHSIVEDYAKDMYDVVVEDFHRRSKAGEIFNNPMLQTEVHFKSTATPLTGSYSVTIKATGELGGNVSVNSPYVDTKEACLARRTLNAPLERLKNVAITAAYAGVTANTQNAVLWAGEFKETLKMVSDIGIGLHALWKKTAKARKEWAKGKLTVPEAQNLTLALLYGILPLEQSIAQVYEGLTKIKPDGRETSRGFQVYTDSSDTTVVPEKSADGKYDQSNRIVESLQVTVRAGVLYDIDASDFPLAKVLMDPKQIVETAYALARLSFVIDWFINVGSTLMAWSPSVGTNILAAYISIEEEYRQEFYGDFDRYIRTWPDTIESGSITGQCESSLVVKTKTRYPINRSDLAILPRLDINLNFSKLNSLVLLFADAKKKN